MVKAEGFVHVKREGGRERRRRAREMHAKSLQLVQDQPVHVLASAACYCYRIPNMESGKCLWRQAIDWV
jgi:hypothetical protein